MRLADFKPGRCQLWFKADIPPGLQHVSARTPLKSIVVASTATSRYGHEGAIPRYVFLHSIVLACLVGVLVTLQSYVYPLTQMVLK
jgi:hypothetical protein